MEKLKKFLGIFLAVIVAVAVWRSLDIDDKSGKIPIGKIIQLNDQWEQTCSEPTYNQYCYKIPGDMDGTMTLSLENSWSTIRILLEGEELYAYSDPHKEFGEQMAWIEIPWNSGGKELTLEIFEEKRMADRVMGNAMYLGEKNAVLLKYLSDSFYALVFFLCTAVASFMIFTFRMKMRTKLSEKVIRQMSYLCAFILDVGIWVLTDSRILQIFINKTSVAVLISFVTFCLMSVFLFPFIKESLVDPGRIFDIFSLMSIINTVLIAGAYLFRLIPMYKVLLLQHLLVFAAIPVILAKGIKEAIEYKNRQSRVGVIGFVFLAVCSVIAFVMFYAGMSAYYAYFYTIGFCIFMFCLATIVYEEVYFYLGKSAETAFYRKLAYVDGLTGLGNRAAFEMYLENVQPAKGMTLILLDNNNLKKVNDNYGHQAGDWILKETARCITESLGHYGSCFRIGGDEFVVAVSEMTEQQTLHRLELMERRIEEVNKKTSHFIEVAYGYCICPEEIMTAREMFEKADENMYKKKQQMKEHS